MARLLYRLGSFSSRHRLAVVGVWLLVLVAVTAQVEIQGGRYSEQAESMTNR